MGVEGGMSMSDLTRQGARAERRLRSMTWSSLGPAARKLLSCPDDTNGDGDCGKRYCPNCGEDGSMTALLDLVAAVKEYQAECDAAQVGATDALMKARRRKEMFEALDAIESHPRSTN